MFALRIAPVIVLLTAAAGSNALGGEYAKLSPFERVEFVEDAVHVVVEAKTYRLLAIDGISVERILGFCEGRYGRIAEKRFAEDLVQVLTEMEHFPAPTANPRRVDLALAEPDTGQTVELEQVEITGKPPLGLACSQTRSSALNDANGTTWASEAIRYRPGERPRAEVRARGSHPVRGYVRSRIAQVALRCDRTWRQSVNAGPKASPAPTTHSNNGANHSSAYVSMRASSGFLGSYTTTTIPPLLVVRPDGLGHRAPKRYRLAGGGRKRHDGDQDLVSKLIFRAGSHAFEPRDRALGACSVLRQRRAALMEHSACHDKSNTHYRKQRGKRHADQKLASVHGVTKPVRLQPAEHCGARSVIASARTGAAIGE